jgi:hypothetical protein
MRGANQRIERAHRHLFRDEPVTQAHVRKEYIHAGRHPDLSRSYPMLDVILISLGLGFFVLSIGYTILCDRL